MTNPVINATKSNMKKCPMSFMNFPCLSSVPPPALRVPKVSFSPRLCFLLYSQAFFLSLWSLGFAPQVSASAVTSQSQVPVISYKLLQRPLYWTPHFPSLPPWLLPDSSWLSLSLSSSAFLITLNLCFLACAVLCLCPHMSWLLLWREVERYPECLGHGDSCPCRNG